MADFVAILTKTIDGLGERNSQEMRQKVYERAKKAVSDKLAAISPPPTPAQCAHQFKLLDDAVVVVEARYAPPPVIETYEPSMEVEAPDPLADFLASVEVDRHQPIHTQDVMDEPSEIPPFPQLSEARASSVDPSDPVLALDGPRQLSLAGTEIRGRTNKGAQATGPLFALLGLLIIGGAGYCGYVYQDQIQAYIGSSAPKAADVATPPVAKEEPTKEAATTLADTNPEAAVAADPEKPASQPSKPKLTQRLNADGSEVDTGPSSNPVDVGEGASVASATTPPGQTPPPVAPAIDEAAQTIAVGQKAIFYEERTGTEQGTADQGSVVWTVVQDSPGLDQPPEPAIRGDINIAEKNIAIKLTIKRNLDKSLPASHIIEMLFITPPEGNASVIENVQQFSMKDTEQAPGNPLVGVPANFGDGFFLIALTDEKTAIETNLALLGKQQWVDIPVTYSSGRRALFSFEKGIPGDKVFEEVMKYWQSKSIPGG